MTSTYAQKSFLGSQFQHAAIFLIGLEAEERHRRLKICTPPRHTYIAAKHSPRPTWCLHAFHTDDACCIYILAIFYSCLIVKKCHTVSRPAKMARHYGLFSVLALISLLSGCTAATRHGRGYGECAGPYVGQRRYVCESRHPFVMYGSFAKHSVNIVSAGTVYADSNRPLS